MGPWVVFERFTNGKTYQVRALRSEQERQVLREQIKVSDVPSAWETDEGRETHVLPRVGREQLGEGVLVPQDVPAGQVEKPAEKIPIFVDAEEEARNRRKRVNDVVLPETPHTIENSSSEPEGRYSLRQVPERRAGQAEKRRRREEEKKRRELSGV